MALQGLADIFISPEAFNVLPFKNYDTQSGDPELTSFFIPAHKFALSGEYLDKRGVLSLLLVNTDWGSYSVQEGRTII